MNTRLKLIRKALGLKQDEFAEMLGLAQGSYSQIESGTKGSITKQTMIILKYRFDVNIDFLYGNSQSMFLNENENKNSNDNNVIEDRIVMLEKTIYSQQKTIELMEEERKKILAQMGQPAICANASGSDISTINIKNLNTK